MTKRQALAKQNLPKVNELRRFIRGHLRAAEVTAQERVHRLSSLTQAQARKEYDQLCQIWQFSLRRQPIAPSDAERLNLLLLRRRRFDLISREGSKR